MDLTKKKGNSNYIVKTVIIGNNGVGKTSIIQWFSAKKDEYRNTHNDRNNHYNNKTIAKYRLTVKNNNNNTFPGLVEKTFYRKNDTVRLKILDTAGKPLSDEKQI